MKKRFKNILLGKKKRNGLLLLTGIAVLTMSLGMLVGCSVGESPADVQQSLEEEAAKPESTGQNEGIPEEETGEALEKAVITCNKEGETEVMPVTLYVGEGFSIYIPDEGWNLSDLQNEAGTEAIAAYSLDAWTSAVNEHVRLWVAKSDEASASEVKSGLIAEGWEETGELELVKQEGETVYHVRLVDDGEACYSIYACCPVEAEEGFGKEMSAIADTFAISIYR